MNRPIAATCFASLLLVPMTAARGDPPTTGPASRPVNELAVIRIGSGNGFWIAEPGTPLGEYGGTSVPIVGAPLPAGHQDAVPVEDYLRTLQAHIPRFRYLVRREGAGGHPAMLPAMDTTDLTLGEWVNYVNATCPDVQIRPDTSVSEQDPLYVVTVLPAATASRPAAEPHVVRAVSIRAAVQVQQRVRAEDEKAALADVLSLVQVLVDTSPDGRGVKLKVHEPTGMLVVDAPPPVADAVAAAVETMSNLTPEQQRLLGLDLAKLAGAQSEARSAESALATARAETEEVRKLNNRNADAAGREIDDLKRQLATVRAGPTK